MGSLHRRGAQHRVDLGDERAVQAARSLSERPRVPQDRHRVRGRAHPKVLPLPVHQLLRPARLRRVREAELADALWRVGVHRPVRRTVRGHLWRPRQGLVGLDERRIALQRRRGRRGGGLHLCARRLLVRAPRDNAMLHDLEAAVRAAAASLPATARPLAQPLAARSSSREAVDEAGGIGAGKGPKGGPPAAAAVPRHEQRGHTSGGVGGRASRGAECQPHRECRPARVAGNGVPLRDRAAGLDAPFRRHLLRVQHEGGPVRVHRPLLGLLPARLLLRDAGQLRGAARRRAQARLRGAAAALPRRQGRGLVAADDGAPLVARHRGQRAAARDVVDVPRLHRDADRRRPRRRRVRGCAAQRAGGGDSLWCLVRFQHLLARRPVPQ
mmetsp:Transcript_2342/g.8350  ORF Transcript_2342/g.8350 Transcript_2342/m.8350 type:complete len:384 (+) Transcript_2342:1302-2453(+)